jgi:MoaA/NifB/PqqE/SkfB family radical SAM enzyme
MDRAAAGSAGRNRLAMIWLELTTRCNLHCRHCYADAGPAAALQGSMSLDHWRAVIDEAVDLGASTVQFIGGEPTLHPYFRALIDHAGKADLRLIEVFTNATRLTDDIVGCLKRNGARVAASFYAEDPGVHDAVTMSPGSWQRTVAGIERVLAANLPVRVGIIATAGNRTHVAPAVAFLKRLGVRDIGIDGERGVGRGRGQAADMAAAKAGEHLTQLCGRCGRARLCVTSTGAVYPCVFSRKTPLGDVRQGLSAALSSPALGRFCSAMELEARSRRQAYRSTGGFCEPGPKDICPPDPESPQPDVDGPWPAPRAHIAQPSAERH